jgi:putative salt-induced outer membrane protein YdiY
LILSFLFSSVLLFSHPGVRADELILKDGSRMLGKVVKKENNTLEFKTSFAGTIKVQWDQVSELITDEPKKVMLSNEEVIKGREFKNTDDTTLVAPEPDAPAQSYAATDISYINPAPWRLGEGFRFTGRANLAFESQRGNTDKDELDIDGNLLWRFKDHRFTMFGELERDKNDGKTTTDKWNTSGAYNYFVTKKWYTGAHVGFESDDFADLNLRALAGPLIGYQFFESKALNLSAEVGVLRVHEEFKSQNNDNYTSLGWQINYDQFVIKDLMQLYHRQGGVWNVQSTSDVVWNTWTGLRFPLILGLVASTEIKVEYDSGAADDADETDTTYTLKLGYQW